MGMQPADLAAVSPQLEIGRIVSVYRAGLFPMELGDAGEDGCGWWSPKTRGVLLPGELRVSKSLRKSMRGMRITWNEAFDDVLVGCADPSRPGAWITDDIKAVYTELARTGWMKSVDVWDRDGELIGGLFGLDLGSVFAGESMFHKETDASKAALVGLVRHMEARCEEGPWLIDAQWSTPHLESLGVSEISELEYAKAVEMRLRGLHTQDFLMQ
ncbi:MULTISPECIES: leucyl/phenylalanyl-tRNA--protein transferase [Brevibacterium]|uniref:leucyl/phenylalanyl-tRNA--protein transferase n=1 Tax=Brevibacterium TaxID=1696 RepID=UPI000AEEEB11|nr:MULTISPECIES: leucyl/phenylalanyl-tRNA--protein transferase [Brevibacterium]